MDMKRFFDWYEPLERRYVFNSFLVVVAVVEVIIFVFTLIWQIDEGVLGGPVRVVPFPWLEYLLVAFAAPIALLLLFGLLIRGFESFTDQGSHPQAPHPEPGPAPAKGRRRAFYLGALLLLACLALVRWGKELLTEAAALFKALGLGGTYFFAALLGGACLFVALRLYLNYRLAKRALELKYRQYLAERHGVVIEEEQGGKTPLLARETEPGSATAPLLEDESSRSEN
jgi:hypothetical protein